MEERWSGFEIWGCAVSLFGNMIEPDLDVKFCCSPKCQRQTARSKKLFWCWYEVPRVGEGEDHDRRCEDVRLTALPLEASQVERRGRRALGRDYGIRMQSGKRCKLWRGFPWNWFLSLLDFSGKRKWGWSSVGGQMPVNRGEGFPQWSWNTSVSSRIWKLSSRIWNLKSRIWNLESRS